MGLNSNQGHLHLGGIHLGAQAQMRAGLRLWSAINSGRVSPPGAAPRGKKWDTRPKFCGQTTRSLTGNRWVCLATSGKHDKRHTSVNSQHQLPIEGVFMEGPEKAKNPTIQPLPESSPQTLAGAYNAAEFFLIQCKHANIQ